MPTTAFEIQSNRVLDCSLPVCCSERNQFGKYTSLRQPCSAQWRHNRLKDPLSKLQGPGLIGVLLSVANPLENFDIRKVANSSKLTFFDFKNGWNNRNKPFTAVLASCWLVNHFFINSW